MAFVFKLPDNLFLLQKTRLIIIQHGGIIG